MGGLLAFLQLPKGCPGSATKHREMWTTVSLTEEMRTKARRDANASGGFEAAFSKERAPNSGDNDDGEPRGLVPVR